MLANITAFKHILRNVDFTVYCDHSALVHIIKAKREPPTLRLQKLVEHLMDYKFSIKFLKGKEMFVTDFLSRHPVSGLSESTNEIIPIAFLLKDATEEWDDEKPLMKKKQKIVNAHNCFKCFPSDNDKGDNFFVMTRSMVKAEGAAVPQMYPLQGDHKRPEVSQTGMIKAPIQQEVPVPKPTQPQAVQAKQATAVVAVEERQPQLQPVQPKVANPNLMVRNVNTVQTVNTNFPNINPAHTLYTAPIQPAPTIPQPSFREERDTNANQENLNLPTNLTTTKGVVPIPLNVKLVGKLPSFEIELDDQEKWMINEVDKNRVRKQLLNKIKIDVDMVRRLLPKQVNLNKFLENLEHKVIHDYKIPLSVKELKAEYFSSPWFQDIYKYLRTGFCRYTGHAKFAFKKTCEDYFLINDVLFKLKFDNNMEEMTTVLCIP